MKSPVNGSVKAPSAPVSPVMKDFLVEITGSPEVSTSKALTVFALYSETRMLGAGKRSEPRGT